MIKKIGFLSLLVLSVGFSSSFASAGLLEIVEKHFQLSDPNYQENPTTKQSNTHYQNTDLRFLLQESEEFMKTDLTSLIANDNRTTLLQNYIADGRNLSQTLDYHYSLNTSLLQSSKTQQDACKTQLNTANNSYQTALKSNQEFLYNQAIIQAKQARSCLGETSVTISSLNQLTKKILAYRNAISKRTNYLLTHQGTILQNYQFLDQKKLSELSSITATLNSTKP